MDGENVKQMGYDIFSFGVKLKGEGCLNTCLTLSH